MKITTNAETIEGLTLAMFYWDKFERLVKEVHPDADAEEVYEMTKNLMDGALKTAIENKDSLQ